MLEMKPQIVMNQFFCFPAFFLFHFNTKKKLVFQLFLNEIIENLKGDVPHLNSCLLVNRFWCTVTVRFLWKDMWDFVRVNYYDGYERSLSILGTLIACLPDESKHFLHANGISIPTPTPNPPLFNYITFIKVLPFFQIECLI